MSQDTGLVKRGFLLLALMSALAVVILVIVFRTPAPGRPASEQRPELSSSCLVAAGSPFPGAVAWLDFYRISEAFPSAEGWMIRYNAAGTLARRGSAAVPWDILLEMLDEHRQLRNFRVQLQDGQMVSDEGAARLTIVSALRAVGDWHKKQKARPSNVPSELANVYAAVDKLANHPIMEIKTQAENARLSFFR
jgi:hypothetical protein